MTTLVDRHAGFAAFRQGRSACLRLHGVLDEAMALGIRHHLRRDGDSVRLRLECSTLNAVEPAAVRILADGVLRWSHARPDRSVDVLNLAPRLERGVAWHPLHAVLDPDELVLVDPDRDDARAMTPSRH